MAKTIVIVVVFVIIGVIVFTAYIRETQPLSTYETKHIRVGTASLEALVADTAEKRTQGLMGVTNLAEGAGMLFEFPDKSVRSFWNKNTYIDLDLLWIADGRVIGTSSLPAITKSGSIVTVSSAEPVDMVIEVNAGWVEHKGIRVGEKISPGSYPGV